MVFSRCAKMGSLTGGERDENPPVVLSSTPVNYSLNFDRDRIEISFDEFIVLDNVNQQLVVSPPLEEKPDVRLRGKSLIIDVNNELKPNTTYTFNFGESITDNNEGNILRNYEFVFSTGDFLDSLSIGGNLLNAFDLTAPEDPVTVMLYDTIYDSVVYKEIPVYIGKTDEEGLYRINNLKADTIKLFALQDVNNNFLFDLPNEKIAFLDSTVIIDPEFFSRVVEEEMDSILSDTTAEEDVLESFTVEEIDSISQPGRKKAPSGLMVDLFLFEEENQIQFLSDNRRAQRNKIEFSFNRPVTDSFQYRSLDPQRHDWYLEQSGMDRDSFTLWIADSTVMMQDSILLSLEYTVLDSLERPVTQVDSLFFIYREPRTGRKREGMEESEKKLDIRTFRKNETVELNAVPKFLSTTPLAGFDTSRIVFTGMQDTLELREDYRLEHNPLDLLSLKFLKEWVPGRSYGFIAYPGAFRDIYGLTNDTIDVGFKIREESYYGQLTVTILDSIGSPVIVQLMDNKETVLKEEKITQPGSVQFAYLKAATYKVKFIDDRNGNGTWDTGKYIESRQPEKVDYYEGDIKVRSNWEMEIKHHFDW